MRLRPGGVPLLVALYLAINAAFAAKYGMRAGSPGAVAVLAYVLAVAIAWWAARAWAPRIESRHPSRALAIGFAVVAGLGLLAAMKHFDPAAIRVTRYPALDQWLGLFLAGKFPYAASSAPSSFPFMFFWALPWRALGDLGYLQIASLIAFATLCATSAATTQSRVLGALAALAGAPIFVYEVVTRSELFSNMVLVLLVLVGLEHARRSRWLMLLAVAAGLALSTRGIVVLAAAVALPFRFRHEIGRGVVFALVGLLTFAATIVPFALWDRARFAAHGPFAIQTSYAPSWLLALAGVLALVLGWRAKTARDLYVGIALALLFPVAAMFLYVVATQGLRDTLLADRFDLSYFAFAHTFVIYVAARFGWSAHPRPQRSISSP